MNVLTFVGVYSEQPMLVFALRKMMAYDSPPIFHMPPVKGGIGRRPPL